MDIYDILGRKVESLVNEEKQPGNYSVTFNAKSITSGVYFYKLEINDYTSIKKMIFLKWEKTYSTMAKTMSRKVNSLLYNALQSHKSHS